MSAPIHVVVLPWSAFGHMIPFLQLSIALAKSGVRVTYVSTPRNIKRLPRVSPSLSQLLTYKEISFPRVQQLPDGAEATVDVGFDKIQYLKVAYDLLEKPFSQIIANHSPDWIITDFASYWAIDIANNHRVPHMFFSVFNAAVRCFVGPKEFLVHEGRVRVRPNPESLTTKPEWVTFRSSVAFRLHEAKGYHAGFFGENASGIRDSERLARVLEGCQVVVIRTCMEFEGEYVELYESCMKKPVIATGLLPPEEINETLDKTWSEVFKWLDEKSPKSVLFVGFGSECKLTKEQVHEIAYGLELSKLPFIWALRKPSWANMEVDVLPNGFQTRTSGEGKVCFGWAPQQRLLAHPSVGGCLFHSGWGSVIESLQYGHVLVVLPFIIDQGLNARLLVDKDLAIEVERREDGSFSREDVARALRSAMVEEEGEKIRVCTRNVAKVFGDSKLHQECYIGGLAEYMRKNAPRTNSP
uniref:UFGT8 n=1 Tax=Fagopyrum tataricum TaxID=62330 RepID=A0A385L2G8_FAGTA|nr:UFGT8 [Fagopyrum tataricum]